MNKENTATLYRKFPELFRGSDQTTSDSPMPPEFFCRDGWFRIVHDLARDIAATAKSVGVAVPVCRQVKEKFGGLRFSLGPIDERIAAVVAKRISEAEALSLHTCEICGAPGERRQLRYVQTLCTAHHSEASDE